MSAMDKMLGDMLKKALPPELIELLAPDHVKAYQERIEKWFEEDKAFKAEVMERLERIENAPGKRTRKPSGSVGDDNGSS